MKVDGIGTTQAPGNVETGKSEKESASSRSFESILDEVRNSPETVAMGCDEVLLAFSGVNPLAMATPKANATGESQSATAQKMSGILTKWENLSSGLATGKATLKEAEGTLKQLSEECQALSEKLDSLPEGHPLKDVGQEMQVLAGVELVKLQRGDYL